MSLRSGLARRAGHCLGVLVAAAAVAAAAAPPAAAQTPVLYQPPVAAPVVDPFRAPLTAYGPGNRGLTYDLAPGTPVRAAADGVVVFAGPVAGALHVTVLHADGRRTSYSFLDSLAVRRGQTVRAGTVVGTAGRGFHFGAREGTEYVDPAGLFGTVSVRVYLVPVDEPLPDTPAGIAREQEVLRWLTRAEEPGLLDRVGDLADAVADKVASAGQALFDLPPLAAAVEVVDELWRWYTTDCTPDDADVPAPAGERTVVLVAGYLSSSTVGSIDDIDLGALGYGPGDDLRFSYRGGRIPDPNGSLAPELTAIPATDYVARDTTVDLWRSGAALADLLEAAAAARPGVPVDVFAHSQGGLVVRVALYELEARGRLDLLGTVVTIGTPHSGADAATAAQMAGPLTDAGIARLPGGLDPSAPSTQQMSEASSFIAELRERGVPDGVDFRTVGGREDYVVTADKSDVPGTPHATVAVHSAAAHGALPAAPATGRELQLALAGMAPACDGFVDAVLDAVLPETIQAVYDTVTLSLFYAP